MRLKTTRGTYDLALASPIRREDGATVLTLTVARADGIEKIAFVCRVADNLIAGDASRDDDARTETILKRLASWIESDFERLREAALKSIRADRRMMELRFDAENRGPF